MTSVGAERPLAHLALFNLPAFAELRRDGGHYKRIDIEHDGRLVATLAGIVIGDEFVSGYGASFGGLDFVRGRESLEIVTDAVAAAVERVRALGVARLRVRAKPFHYSHLEEYLHFALCRGGFAIEEVNLNFFVDLALAGSAQSYRTRLRHAPERQLRLALGAGLAWREAPPADWGVAYEVLVESRRRHGASLSLSYDEVAAMRAAFGERIRMFVLEHDAFAVAAVLLYAVTPSHAMVMYWGDREDRTIRETGGRPPVAVMNLVAYRTVETGIASGYRTLDLGPVSTADRINFGNARFKSSIDATPNFRYTFTRTL